MNALRSVLAFSAMMAAAACTTPASPPQSTTTTVPLAEPTAAETAPANPGDQPLADPADQPLAEPPAGDPGKPPVAQVPAGDPDAPGFVACTPQSRKMTMCTQEHKPVCAVVDTGIRCIRAPCPSTAQQTFSNACMACADAKTSGYRPGECPPLGQGSCPPGAACPEVQ